MQSHTIIQLVAPFLPMKTIVGVGNGELIRQELISRYSWSADDMRIIMLSRNASEYPKHISAILDVEQLLRDICDCHLIDVRTKAQLYTFVESGFKSGNYRGLYIWYIFRLWKSQEVVARHVHLNETREKNGYALVQYRCGSVRIYIRQTNEVIGFYDRCSSHVIAHQSKIDEAVMALS